MNKLRCYCCGKDFQKGGLKYIVEVKSFADYDGYLEEYPGDISEGINELLEAIENMDTKTLEEDVFRERSYVVCKPCRDKLADDPFHAEKFENLGEAFKGTVH